MRITGSWSWAGVVALVISQIAQAEPSWTKTGNCQSCHTALTPVAVDVYGDDGLADPDGSGSRPLQKIFRLQRSQTKPLKIQVSGLASGDPYAVALLGVKNLGIGGSTLGYSADCAWAQWWSSTFYSNPEANYRWGLGPTDFTYSIVAGSTAAYDTFDLVFAVAGVLEATGEFFYNEEHFYLQVVPPNQAPSVSITSPVTGATFNTPANITMTATASDNDGTVTKVDFFQGTTLLGTATTGNPYSIAWNSVSPGSYTLTAKATDNGGMTQTSNPVTITVQGRPGDMDGDGDVDQSDFGPFQACLGATSLQIGTTCKSADMDSDVQVNASDVYLFRQCMSGSKVPANFDCLP